MTKLADKHASLNEQQKAVVEAGDGPILVLAAAGTGKTRTLVHRVSRLVECGVRSQEILLLTFTNKAAREMLDRATDLVGESIGGLWGGTFHHMANRILRQHAYRLGYEGDYTIMDRDDSKTLIKNCLKDRKLASKDFPKPDVLLGIYSWSANTQANPEDVARQRFDDHEVNVDDVVKVIRDYVARKRSLGAMDFDDLLVNGLALFQEHPQVLDRYREQFRYVLVDEYQDTNVIQAAWVDLVASQHRNLLVVGDDFQSIYSWRGANFRNIINFPEKYPEAQQFKLEINYRSVPEILAVANTCISGNKDQFQKTLRATRDSYKKPVEVALRDGGHQARFVVAELQELRRNGYKLSDIAILYRAHFHAMEVQLELTRAGIPYVITSGMRFFEQAHIKDVCCVLRLVHNPFDELALCRLLELLPKVGPRTALKVWNRIDRRCQILDPICRAVIAGALPAAAQAGWEKISALFDRVVEDSLVEDFGEIMHAYVQAFYDQYAVDTFDDYDRRLDDIRELILFTAKFEAIDEFLSEVALMSNVEAEEQTDQSEDEDGVRMSTIHQAKGLEYPVVIGLWMVDGMFPSSRSLNEEGEGESEERRLFYVMVTRAKDELYLCYPEVRRTRDGGVIVNEPSRFLTELPGELLRKRNVGFI